jgi:ATP adenylyltransferase
MERLWSPWRYRYVSTVTPRDECVFCAKQRASNDEENLVLIRGEHNFVLLNLYPYTTGHLMVVPYAHVAALDELDEAATNEMMALTRRSVAALNAVYHPQGMNLGMNIGECAGAGIAGHLHMHVLPRWAGDANFMTTVAGTRVMPEELSESWRKLRAAFAAL